MVDYIQLFRVGLVDGAIDLHFQKSHKLQNVNDTKSAFTTKVFGVPCDTRKIDDEGLIDPQAGADPNKIEFYLVRMLPTWLTSISIVRFEKAKFELVSAETVVENVKEFVSQKRYYKHLFKLSYEQKGVQI